MKVLPVISTAALFLLLGTTVPAFAHEGRQDAKPEKQEEQAKPTKQKKVKTKPAKQEAAKPAKQEEQAKAKPAQHEEQAKPAKQAEQAKAEKQPPEAKPVKQEERGKSGGQHAQRTSAEEQRQRSVPALRLSARGSGRIPDDRFHANFGQEHVFVINEPIMVGGFSRFQYGGFYFGFVDPWPDGWYYTDDVYVDYIDGGYYLCNPYYPDARVSISVVI